ncbi:MAG: glutamate--tRNA ligase family protein [Candidatus Levybacteria bacterium]|nr:glutamate--tRNA ligase family protein [Candidatus Levybacteria bacterium]
MIRVRFAPSPTGIPHIGNTRSAVFNYLFAKHNNGKFIVRIEDTDQARIVPGAKEAIFEILNWLGVSWDEEYVQSERKNIYREHVDQLIQKGIAYKDEGAVRFKIPAGREISWLDAIGSKKIIFKTDIVEDFVILKSDGFPTYHLANVVDDHLMNISHVIRGDEWISSTPKHILLYEAFGWDLPVFAHLPVILGPDKTKLSKRHGARSVLDLRREGYLKESLINFMGLLGWSHPQEKEIISIDEMIRTFDLKDVGTVAPIFDLQKLTWMNGEYIRMMDNKTLKAALTDFYKEDEEVISFMKNESIDSILGLAKTRLKTLAEFKNLVINRNPELSPDEKNIAKILSGKFELLEKWNKEAILGAMRETLKENKAKGSLLYKITTGYDSGLPLPESLEILGKEKTLERIEKTLN